MFVVNSNEEEADTGVTYFVDEEGHYYYQPSGEQQNLVSFPTEAETDENNEVML